MSKIFGIGLSKTGTQSLAMSLRLLGYRTVHFPLGWDEILSHDASCDITVSKRFKMLDSVFPEARFILTVRKLNSWLTSCQNHFIAEREPWRGKNPSEWNPYECMIAENEFELYGAWIYDEVKFTQGWHRHNENVRSYFQEKYGDSQTNKLLELNIEKGDGWKKLTAFLGISDEVPFPWENKKGGSA